MGEAEFMFSGWIILLVSLIYMGLLFAIAYYVDRRADNGHSIINNPYIYALSLAVYCTAWTFYGSVGRATKTGIGFLPIYLGPTLMVGLWGLVLRKMIRISKINHITSIADFIAARYGKSGTLGGLVTIVSVFGIIPYISLQLKAISTSLNLLLHYPNLTTIPTHTPLLTDVAFYVTWLLVIFAILFGTRHLDVTEHHEGLVASVAFESIIKLIAFLTVGLFVTFGLYNGWADLFTQVAAHPSMNELFTVSPDYANWTWLMVLSAFAIFLLPRQFQMAVIENVNEQHLYKAIWLFPLYMFIINLFVLPIALGGLLRFSIDISPDMFVLLLPLSTGHPFLTLLVYLGGFSAATSMVIVETVALSTMASNHLVIPWLLQPRFINLTQQANLSGLILMIRRGVIVIILILGYAYFRLSREVELVSIGLISFAAVAQFAPLVLGGMYWKEGHRYGALAGLTAGFVVWGYTLPLPSLVASGWLPTGFVEHGLGGIAWLKPYALLGLVGLDPITHAMLWSMLLNVGLYVSLSLISQQTVLEYEQATNFVDVFKQSVTHEVTELWRGQASVAALQKLLERFLGVERSTELLTAYAKHHQIDWHNHVDADATLVNFIELQLAGAIGTVSARAMVASVVTEEPLTVAEVMTILDETSQALAYSRRLERATDELRLLNTQLQEAEQLAQQELLERKRAEAALQEANELLAKLNANKDKYFSILAHDLKGPFMPLLGLSEMLPTMVDKLTASDIIDISSSINRSARHIYTLLENLLEWSRLQMGRMEYAPCTFDVSQVILVNIDLLLENALYKHITLKSTISTSMEVYADRNMIDAVIRNLMSNAIKFTPNEGTVTISAQTIPSISVVEVVISDTGVGISKENIHKLFKIEMHHTTLGTGKERGTGLGLIMCQEMVQRNGGTIWVESELGYGTAVKFTIPTWGHG